MHRVRTLTTGVLAASLIAGSAGVASATPAISGAAARQCVASSRIEASRPMTSVLSPSVVQQLMAAAAAAGVDVHTQSTTLAATCGDTNFTVWIRQHTSGWKATDMEQADALAMLPMLEALYYPQTRPTFGDRGQYTGTLTKEMAKLRGFWNIDGKRVGLGALHSSIFASPARLNRLFRDLGDLSQKEAEAQTKEVRKLVNQKKFDYGRHPIFTLNAFASPGMKYKGKVSGPRIVMGDGILRAMADLGWGSVAPQEILAHEYGHQVQFANKLASNGNRTPAQSQYIELMADAYGAYYLRHPKGANMDWNRVNSYLQVAYATGDCSFTNVAHHGTPDQRMASANWGTAKVQAFGAPKIAQSKGFANTFKAAYKTILNH